MPVGVPVGVAVCAAGAVTLAGGDCEAGELVAEGGTGLEDADAATPIITRLSMRNVPPGPYDDPEAAAVYVAAASVVATTRQHRALLPTSPGSPATDTL